MPRKRIIPFHQAKCPICASVNFYKNGNCKACTKRMKREEAKIRNTERPAYSQFCGMQNTRSESFRKKEARIMEEVDYS